MPGQPLLCRLGLHKIDAINRHELREDGVWYDITLNRCSREDCPQSLWWKKVDIEVAYWQMSFEREDPAE